jgi:hypothetical protein
LNQVSVLSSQGPASGTASRVRPVTLESEYSRSVASSRVQPGASFGSAKRIRVRAFCPTTGSPAAGSPVDPDRTVSSVSKR